MTSSAAEKVDAAELQHRAEEDVLQMQKVLSAILIGETTANSIFRLRKCLKEEPVSRLALLDPNFGPALAARQGISKDQWSELIAETAAEARSLAG